MAKSDGAVRVAAPGGRVFEQIDCVRESGVGEAGFERYLPRGGA